MKDIFFFHVKAVGGPSRSHWGSKKQDASPGHAPPEKASELSDAPSIVPEVG